MPTEERHYLRILGMDYDVIIVGGRPAGASLAARLGERDLRVLVVDRAEFPSLPGVPSAPIMFPCAIELVAGLGIPEASYSDPDAKMWGIGLEVDGYFSVKMPVPKMSCGRDYFYGIERTTFDDILWENLARYPSVERRPGFAVVDLIEEEGRVLGVVLGPRGEGVNGEREEVRARCVVGADGRFSFVARRVGAQLHEVRNQHTSTVYYADWEGVNYDEEDEPWAHICTNARGVDIISFAMPGGRYTINTHTRSDRTLINGDLERYYHEAVRSLPCVSRRLAQAQRVSPIYGVKHIGNGYRRASGPGWVLCGDAVHHKDPVDGQGIYDALLGTQLLASALASALAGEAPWEQAMATYEHRLRELTHPMFMSTTGRLKRELYGEPPQAVIKTLIRWRLSDPSYHEAFLRVLNRELAPGILDSPWEIAASVGRGIKRDVAGLFGRS